MWSKKLDAFVEANKPQSIKNLVYLAKKAGLAVYSFGNEIPGELIKGLKDFAPKEGESLIVLWGEPVKNWFGKVIRQEFSALKVGPESYIPWLSAISQGSVSYSHGYDIKSSSYHSSPGGNEYLLNEKIRNQIADVKVRLPEKVVELPIPNWLSASSQDYGPAWIESTLCFESEAADLMLAFTVRLGKSSGNDDFVIVKKSQLKELVDFADHVGIPTPNSIRPPKGDIYRLLK